MNKNIKINGKILSRYSEIVSGEALQFVQEIHEQFNNKRLELLEEIYWMNQKLKMQSLNREFEKILMKV